MSDAIDMVKLCEELRDIEEPEGPQVDEIVDKIARVLSGELIKEHSLLAMMKQVRVEFPEIGGFADRLDDVESKNKYLEAEVNRLTTLMAAADKIAGAMFASMRQIEERVRVLEGGKAMLLADAQANIVSLDSLEKEIAYQRQCNSSWQKPPDQAGQKKKLFEESP